VEAALGAHPKVRDVAVIGLPHDKWGEAVTAVVVLHDGQRCAAAELDEWCRARLAGFKRPRRIVFLAESELPRTATGKILHRVLRDRLAMAETEVAIAGGTG
jgi:fatty-acyl-CoA synthase